MNETILIPAAGKGTRFRPFTLAVPKELLPILNRPIIDYVLDEALSEKISSFVMIVSPNKEIFQKYVTRDCQASKASEIVFVPQEFPKGLGHAILCAREHFKDSHVSIALPDNIFKDGVAWQKMQAIAQKHVCSIIAVARVPDADISKYGIVRLGDRDSKTGLQKIVEVVEKPALTDAPSNFAIIGRYVLSTKIFDYLNKAQAIVPEDKELQLTDSLQSMIDAGLPVYAYDLETEFFDVGTPAGWLKTIMHFAGQDEKLKKIIKRA